MSFNKGDIVYVLERDGFQSSNQIYRGTIIKKVNPYHGIYHILVEGDGYFVSVEYETGKWSKSFKTKDIIKWTKGVKRDSKLKDLGI